MSLNKVYLPASIYRVCLEHAFSSKTEEIMGLLIGTIDHDNMESHIYSCKILPRSVKKSDRVEISPEYLTMSSQYAEDLSARKGKKFTVMGWYHSHPNITVHPSNVDLGTQMGYQQFDPLFVGLIFSVYTTVNNSHCQPISVTCFQARTDGKQLTQVEVPLEITADINNEFDFETIWELCNGLLREAEDERRQKCANVEQLDSLARLRNDSLYFVKIINIIKKVFCPTMDMLECRYIANQMLIEQLSKKREQLTDGGQQQKTNGISSPLSSNVVVGRGSRNESLKAYGRANSKTKK